MYILQYKYESKGAETFGACHVCARAVYVRAACARALRALCACVYVRVCTSEQGEIVYHVPERLIFTSLIDALHRGTLPDRQNQQGIIHQTSDSPDRTQMAQNLLLCITIALLIACSASGDDVVSAKDRCDGPNSSPDEFDFWDHSESCHACTAMIGCGFCLSTVTCSSGDGVGPLNGDACPGGPEMWSYEEDGCFALLLTL